MLNKQILYVTGLPFAGSALLCQLLGQHPDIYNSNSESPLCQILTGLRQNLSAHSTLTAQLHSEFDRSYQRVSNAFQGFVQGWFTDIAQPWAIDYNQDWLQHLEMLHCLDPNCRLVVCVRELTQIYADIEAQHQQTLLLDFPERLADLSRADRAIQLFSPTGAIGSRLKAIESLQYLEETLQQRLYYVVFEHLISEPAEALQGIYSWLNLPSINDNPLNLHSLPSSLTTSIKYREMPVGIGQPTSNTPIPERFETLIKQSFGWFYATFYPGLL